MKSRSSLICLAIPILTLLLTVGCVAAPIVPTTPSQKVRTLREDPPAGYEDIGPIVGQHGSACAVLSVLGESGTYESAYADLKNQTAAMGGHAVRIDAHQPNSTPPVPFLCADLRWVIIGVAYRDPERAPLQPGRPGANGHPELPAGTPAEKAVRLDTETLWQAWAARGTASCADARTLLESDAGCKGQACSAPIVLSAGYLRACSPSPDDRIVIHQLRKAWTSEAGEGSSACLVELYRAARDPKLIPSLSPRCPGEGKTEAFLRDAIKGKAAGGEL